MFKFLVKVDCPICEEHQQVKACYDSELEPYNSIHQCIECDAIFTVTPEPIQVDCKSSKVINKIVIEESVL